MKKIAYIWTRLYYGLFLYHSWTQILLHKVLWVIPIRFLCKLGILNKEKYDGLNKEVARSLTDEKISIVILITDATMLAFTALMLVTSILIVPINYYALWRKDKYLERFKEFRKSSSLRNWIWAITSISAVILALLLFILSLHLI